jgi:hypothetical protein
VYWTVRRRFIARAAACSPYISTMKHDSREVDEQWALHGLERPLLRYSFTVPTKPFYLN